MSTLSILAAFLRRDLTTAVSYRAMFGLQILASLFALALFFYLGHIVDNAKFAEDLNLSGGYFAYAVVGLALLEIVDFGLTSFSTKLREEQTTGTFEALMATPVSPSVIVLSSAAYSFLRATLYAVGLIAVAVVIFGLQLEMDAASFGIAILALVGSIGLFASVGVTVAAFTVIFKKTTALMSMVVSGLALLGGVYFPVEVLPAPLELVANAIPFTWALDVLRAALLGGDVDPAQLAGLFASAVLLLPVSLLFLRRSIDSARRSGTLAQY